MAIIIIHADLYDYTICEEQYDGIVECYCKDQLAYGTGGLPTLDLLLDLDEKNANWMDLNSRTLSK